MDHLYHQYPDPDKWYHIQQADDKLIHFLSWLSEEIRREIAKISKDPLQYNRHLEKHLPYEKRTGKILRETFWSIVGDDTIWLDKELHPAVISDLEKLLTLNKEMSPYPWE